jgi:hypothetical protein
MGNKILLQADRFAPRRLVTMITRKIHEPR